MVDSQLNMSSHVTVVSRSCMFQLHQLKAVKHYLSTYAAKTLVSAFSAVDSATATASLPVLPNVTSGLMTKPQSVQKAAEQFILKFDHIKPILRKLDIRRRVDFKVATMVHKCLHGLGPPYLIDTPVSLSGRQHLRSADTRKLFVSKTSTNFGSQFFAIFEPNLFKSLPTELRTIKSVFFHRKLKTHLFSM